ncbi:alpha-internexin [Denticeps clupeoides]|uniref:IF rod domain-containing protein n=1 Tax=Denticeps clupeoides TaxID=299321 RepID=A0AAY4ETA2_9TELE|nr:alpha-internexin-like [Denticeps clupeoides]
MSCDPFLFSSFSRCPWDDSPRVSSRLLRPSQPWTSGLYRKGVVRCERAMPLERRDLAQASAVSAELRGVRAQEREQLVDLNDRFACYIERVRELEHHNRALLAQLEALRRSLGNPSRLQRLYEDEARGLRAQLHEEAVEKSRMEAQRDHVREELARLRERWEDESERRGQAEEALRQTREEASRAVLGNCDGDASLVSLTMEVRFLRKVFTEEEAGLRAELQALAAGRDAVGVPVGGADLSGALREIRSQYEWLAGRNTLAAEDWFRGKMTAAAEVVQRNEEAVRAVRTETAEYRRQLKARSAEVEALRSAIDSLNSQLTELEEAQGKEVTKYQEKIMDLERDIGDAKEEMSRYLREYQELLNVKMALDIEIAAYRKLLEGEEIRLTFSALPALA